MNTFTNIDNYIATFPKETQRLLKQMRITIKKAAPEAEEAISYAVPTFKLNGNLVHFAAYKNHIGFYPAPSAIKAFAKELSVYVGAKGSVQFPLNKPLPLKLVAEMVKLRVKENTEKAEAKKKLKNASVLHVDFLSDLAGPARRALQNKGIATLQQLAAFSEAEILKLHGMGQASLPKLRVALKKQGLSFIK